MVAALEMVDSEANREAAIRSHPDDLASFLNRLTYSLKQPKTPLLVYEMWGF